MASFALAQDTVSLRCAMALLRKQHTRGIQCSFAACAFRCRPRSYFGGISSVLSCSLQFSKRRNMTWPPNIPPVAGNTQTLISFEGFVMRSSEPAVHKRLVLKGKYPVISLSPRLSQGVIGQQQKFRVQLLCSEKEAQVFAAAVPQGAQLTSVTVETFHILPDGTVEAVSGIGLKSAELRVVLPTGISSGYPEPYVEVEVMVEGEVTRSILPAK